MPKSVVDETIARHLKRGMALKQSSDNPSTGTLPGTVFQPAKPNSGTYEEWQSITDEGMLLVSNEAAEKNRWVSKEALDGLGGHLVGAPQDFPGRSLLQRDAIMQELKELMGEPVDMSSEFVLYKDSDDTYKSSDLGFSPEDYNVCLIKMWGFAAMGQTESPLVEFRKAVHAIIAGKDGKKGAMQTILNQKQKNMKTQFVLQFDGDAAYEKDDPGESKKLMSHNLFAPYVAKLIKQTVPGAKVHLCIAKLEGDTTKTQEDLMKKFGYFMSSSDKGGGEFGDPFKLRTSTNANNAVLDHRYPYYDRRFFDSVTFMAKFREYPIIAVKDCKAVRDYASEHITQKMVEDLYGSRIMFRVCVAFGGNTHNGVQAMKKEIDAGNLEKWNLVWRHLIYATK